MKDKSHHVAMDPIWLRDIQKREFLYPLDILTSMRATELEIASSQLAPRIKHLRTNTLKPFREAREAALFCHAMTQRTGVQILLSLVESEDFDFVAAWIDDGTQHFAKVQLKEVVPEALNKGSGLDQVIESLSTKYTSSPDLTVAIHLNRTGHFDPNKLTIPNLNLAGLWTFGAISQDQVRWALWGDFLASPYGTDFEYPKIIG